jgi:putative transposase
MKRSQYTESQILAILKEVETGTSLDKIYRTHGINRSCYDKWKTIYSGLEEAELPG